MEVDTEFDITNIRDFIKKSFNNLDKRNKKYDNLLSNNVELDIINNRFIDKTSNSVIADIYNISTLGIYYHDTNIFVWGWVLPNLKKTIATDLLFYALTLELNAVTIEQHFIRSLLVNSRIYIENDFNLQLLQAVALNIYNDRFDFIYSTYNYENDNTNKNKKISQTVFHLIKISSN